MLTRVRGGGPGADGLRRTVCPREGAGGRARFHDPAAGRAGFTLVEVIVALTILLVGLLGMGVTGGGMIRSAMRQEALELATQAAEDRLAAISMDPRYASLDSLYAGTESVIPELPGFTRTTTIRRTQTPTQRGTIDYQEISVVVTAPGLDNPVGRVAVVGAP